MNWKGGKINIICSVCSKEFLIDPYEKGKRQFCSVDCYHHALKNFEKYQTNIVTIGKKNKGMKFTEERRKKHKQYWDSMIGRPITESFRNNCKKSMKTRLEKNPMPFGEKASHWKGGRTILQGYIRIYSPNHPYKSKHGYVAEHRLIMEQHIGRFLNPSERVHHINGIKTDNRIENLVYCPSESFHQKTFHKKSLFK